MREPRLDALSVLIVDDSRPMCDLVASMLKAFGIHRTVTCCDAASALAVLRKNKIDLLLTDLAMPETDGIQFVRSLRMDPNSPAPFTPVLMVTGYSDRAHVEAARDAGVNEFLVKPITTRALFDRLVALIDSPRAFVRSELYMGPDRRRRNLLGYSGPLRRASDVDAAGSAVEV
jgi:two-component system, chemotaxis family, chemotaxis protein CheY